MSEEQSLGKVELLNKEDEGCHYLKVLLLSNKLNGNRWQAPYNDIKELPKQLLDSFIDLPFTVDHDYNEFLNLYNKLEREGKQYDDIRQEFRKVSEQRSVGKVTRIFTDYSPSKELLYGEVKITDKEWNKFIEENGRPPYEYTSPGMLGIYDITEDGSKIYHIDTTTAYQISAVAKPAFPPHEAKLRAICSHKDSACRMGIAIAGMYDDDVVPAAQTKDKNLNTDTNNNTNIHMSNQENTPNAQVTTTSTTTGDLVTTATTNPNSYTFVTNPTPEVKMNEKGYDKNSDITAKLHTELRQSGEPEPVKKASNETKEKDTAAEERLKKLEAELELARKEKAEQRNFILDKILLANIPRENFKKDEEFEAERTAVKGMINKYNMSYDDSEWFVKKAYPRIQEKGKNPLTAGLQSSNNTLFTPSSLTATSTESKPQESKGYCPTYPLPLEF